MSAAALLALPVAVPLLAAGLALAAPRRPAVRRACTLGATAVVLALGGLLLGRTAEGRTPAVTMGGWPPGVGIVFAADTLSALLLTVNALLVLVTLAFAAAAGEDRHPLFGPLALILSAGVYGALLTADLFNLFVLVEVMLVPSYALLTMAGGPERRAAGRLYLAYNLLASTVFLVGLGLLYGLTGTLNLAELAGAAAGRPEVALAGGVLLVAMAAKAAVVPLHGWLRRTYPYGSPAVTALFSGLLTKVGLYVIVRLYAVVYQGDPGHLWLLLTTALVSMVIGVLGALGEQTMRAVLTFHMVSQIGYALLGLALFTHAGLTAMVFFLVQYVLVKAALLLCAGAVEHRYGTGELERLGGLARREPLLALCFVVAALSLAGLPPLSGFVAKLALLRAAAADDAHLALGVAVAVSALTLLSMLKIWTAVFARRPERETAGATARASGGAAGTDEDGEDGETGGEAGAGGRPESGRRSPARSRLVLPAAALAAFSLLLGFGAEPLLAVSGTAASGLTDTTDWVRAVLTS